MLIRENHEHLYPRNISAIRYDCWPIELIAQLMFEPPPTHTAPLENVVSETVSVDVHNMYLHLCCISNYNDFVCRYQRRRTPMSARSFHPLLPSPRTGRSFRPCSFSMMCPPCSTTSLTSLAPQILASMKRYVKHGHVGLYFS